MAELGDDLIFILLFIILLGHVWIIPKEDIYNGIVTILAAAIAAGWLLRRKRRRRD